MNYKESGDRLREDGERYITSLKQEISGLLDKKLSINILDKFKVLYQLIDNLYNTLHTYDISYKESSEGYHRMVENLEETIKLLEKMNELNEKEITNLKHNLKLKDIIIEQYEKGKRFDEMMFNYLWRRGF